MAARHLPEPSSRPRHVRHTPSALCAGLLPRLAVAVLLLLILWACLAWALA